MSRDVITVGSTMRISLLYRGEYSQLCERFRNYLEEQTHGEAMINSIQNGLPNDIYSFIDSNKTAKDLWDALERQMRGLMIDDLKKCGYKKDNCELNYKFLNNLQPEWKQYVTLKRQTKNLMDINIDALYNILKKNQGDVNDALGYKKKAFVVTSDPLALVVEKMKKAKVKDYNYYKTKMLLAKKDSDEQMLLAEDQDWMESSSDSDKEINANMVFLDQIEKVLLDSDESFSSAEETIVEVAYYTFESESESEYETSKYYDNSTNYALFVNDNDDQEFFHDAIESASENFIENHIDSQKEYDKSEVDHNDTEGKEHLIDKLIQKFNHKIAKCQKRIEKANQQTKDLENQNKDIQEIYDVLINKQTSSLKPYVSTVILEKIIIDLEDEVMSLLEKEKANLKTIESLKSKDLGTFSSVRRPKHISVIWKKKGSSNTSNVDLSSVRHSKLNKGVKRYSRKDLLSYNNSHLGETSCACVCNDAMNVSCNSRLCDSFNENNLFIFDDESVRISPISKMPFRKKPHDSLNVSSKRNSNQSLPRTVHRWLLKMRPLAEPVDCPDLSLDHRFEMFKAYDGCYLLNNYDDVVKLKAKGNIGVFVGYSKESAAFRIYNKQTRKIHESVNVNFDEISVMASKQFSLESIYLI
nr:integrase, catalytic region, zinc finger, CCHC-type, peptidase aspartic, catalytic [Tanacetum cinerariifolium]